MINKAYLTTEPYGSSTYMLTPTNGLKRKKTVAAPEKVPVIAASIHALAFEHLPLASIISRTHNGMIITANHAARKLLGYSKREISTMQTADIFDVTEFSYKALLRQSSAAKQPTAFVTVRRKKGKPLACKMRSASFVNDQNLENSIFTLTDMAQSILVQKNIDAKKEKIVADNIALALSKQKKRDNESKKKASHNLVLAKAASFANQEIINAWKKYIGKESYDVMWDWDITTGEIYIGDSVREVFGYRLENNTVPFSYFMQCLVPAEKYIVKRKLLKSLASNSKTWSDTYKIKRRDGTTAATQSRGSIIRDKDGKAIHLIGAIQDISKLRELEKNLQEEIVIKKENNEIFQLAAKLSYDGIWDWNLLTNAFFLGDGSEKLFGSDIDNPNANISDWTERIHPADKKKVEKGLRDAIASYRSHWEQAYRFIRTDGSVAEVFCRASIIRQSDGTACRIIGAIHDLSHQKDLEEKLHQETMIKEKLLTEYSDSFSFVFNSSSDLFYDADLDTDQIILSAAYEKEFGYKINGNMTPAANWIGHIHPDDKESVLGDYQKMLASAETEWKSKYRFLKADGTVANVISNGVILRNAAGKAYRMIGYMHDNSKQNMLEEKLEHEIKLKEKQIADAAEEAKETERSDIGRELHDNVNQLLGASKLYLDMAKRGGPDSAMLLGRSSQYTLTAIEEIRKLTKGLSTETIKNLGLREALEDICHATIEAAHIKVRCQLRTFEEDSVNTKFKLNIFRIVQEHLNNILKHAKATKINISIVQNKNSIALNISDNGIGFDTSKKQKGIGIDNIKSRASSYNGEADFISEPGKGCTLSIRFPLGPTVLDEYYSKRN